MKSGNNTVKEKVQFYENLEVEEDNDKSDSEDKAREDEIFKDYEEFFKYYENCEDTNIDKINDQIDEHLERIDIWQITQEINTSSIFESLERDIDNMNRDLDRIETNLRNFQEQSSFEDEIEAESYDLIQLGSFNLTCPYCFRLFQTRYNLVQHLSEHHSYCRCNDCDRLFINDTEFQNHNCLYYDSGENFDSIPTDNTGEYFCPNCQNRYSNANFLGEHFIRTHSSYSDYTNLDERCQKDGFPGFELLEQIRMIL